MKNNLKELTGRRFGTLIVLRRDGADKFGHAKWLVQCDCGEQRTMLGDNLVRRAKTCGGTKHKNPSGFCHGKSHTTSHNVWLGMRQRCENKNNPAYVNYGARGISVCARWHLFENFLEDMGECPCGLTIERIDNNGNYEPANCKWATRIEQGTNKRNNVLLTFQGKTQTISQWARDIGIHRNTLYNRLTLLNWQTERALTL